MIGFEVTKNFKKNQKNGVQTWAKRTQAMQVNTQSKSS